MIAGIANASSHSGRRSGLSTRADKGVRVRVLMPLAGHSQNATTQRYIDLRLIVVRAVELVYGLSALLSRLSALCHEQMKIVPTVLERGF